MQTFLYEIKKMYIFQRGLLFVGLFILLHLVILYAQDKPANYHVEANLTQYYFYLEKVEGHLSSQSEQFLQEESQKINEAKVETDKLYDSYYNGDITESAFIQERSKLEEILKNQAGFDAIFEQYIYVRENPDERYFLYTSGWDALLGTENLDYFAVLLILLLVTPIFCQEFENSMDSLMLTMKKGGRSQAVCKIVLVFTSIILTCIFSFGFTYLFYDIKYGLQNGDYPLQSLSFFSTSTKNLTLTRTYIYLCLFKLFGYLSFSVLIMFLSVCIKRYALTLFASVAAVFLPFIGVENSAVKYLCSGPLGFMLATGFFRGSQFKTDSLTDEVRETFKEIPVSSLLVSSFVVLCIVIFMLYILIKLRSNEWQRSISKKMRGTFIFSSALVLLSLGITGCSQQSHYDVYNYSAHLSFQNDQYRFYVDDSDLNHTRLMYKDLVTGEIHDLVKTPMQSSLKIERTLYGNGNYIYYIKYHINKSELKDYVDRVAIIEVDTKNFNERVIFERNTDLEKKLLMGTIIINNKDAVLQNIGSFFLNKNNIYFINRDVRQVNRVTGKTKILDIPTNANIAYDGKRIYYIGDRYQLSYYDTENETKGVVPDIITTKFYLDDTKMLFLNRLDQKKLYILNLQDNSVKKVLDKTVLDFRSEGAYIYYQDISDLQEYKIKM
nr:hypothetical protein [uncultured Clostridium sp.]